MPAKRAVGERNVGHPSHDDEARSVDDAAGRLLVAHLTDSSAPLVAEEAERLPGSTGMTMSCLG